MEAQASWHWNEEGIRIEKISFYRHLFGIDWIKGRGEIKMVASGNRGSKFLHALYQVERVLEKEPCDTGDIKYSTINNSDKDKKSGYFFDEMI